MIKYCFKDAFAVIGKAGQGSTENFGEWTDPLWALLESNLSEIEGMVRKNKEGKPFFWSALNDKSESNKRWGEPGFDDSGKYMAACEADVDIIAPAGWVKWIIPAQTYIVVRSTATELEDIYASIVENNSSKIVGVGHSFFPEYGNDDLVDTYIPIANGMMHCQSCGMPMTEDSHFGKNVDGSTNEDYCCHCYSNGAFPGECTMEEMIEICVPLIVENGVCPDSESARKMLSELLPTLKRWKKQNIEKLQAISKEVYPLVVPRILLGGQSAQALELYQKAFNATVTAKILFADADPTDLQYTGKEKDNLVYYSELMIGNHMVMVSDDVDGMLGNHSGQRSSLTGLCVSFDCEEKAKAACETLSDGAKILTPIKSNSFSTFFVTLEDKFGVVWDLYFGAP